MGKDQDLILAVRNLDLNYLHKVLQKPGSRSSLKLSKYIGVWLFKKVYCTGNACGLRNKVLTKSTSREK